MGFNDGRRFIDETEVNVGDTCLKQITERKILEVIKLEKDTKGLIIQGINAGEIGKINEIKEGTFILPKRVNITIGDRQIEIPSTLVMPVGKGEPPIQIR